MPLTRTTMLVLLFVLLAGFGAACGRKGEAPVTIVSINLNPGTALAGGVVQLSAAISAPGRSVTTLTKDWAVTAGTLSVTEPDFSLLLRETAQANTALSTTNGTVFWLAPPSPSEAVITLSVENDIETRTVQVGASPVVLSVSDGAGGAKVCTVSASGVTDLYQAAFRINCTSAWDPASAEPGDFLGEASEILFMGLTDQSGFVPCAITKRGDVAGTDGSGTLATVTFDPGQSASAARELAHVPFELAVVVLRTSRDEPIALP